MRDTTAGDRDPAPGAAAVAGEDFRQAMSLMPSPVHLVTSDGPAGPGGVTITAMASVSDAPPTVLFCLNRGSRFAPVLTANGCFCINTLAAGAENVALAETFAGRLGTQGDARFDEGHWLRLETGAPVLASARIAFDCRLTAIQDVATHKVVLGEVVGLRLGEAAGDTLAYQHRAYKGL